MPALGPSLGVAPSGTCRVHHRHVEKIRLATKLSQMRHDVAVGNLGALFHHIAQLTRELEAPVQGMDFGRLDAKCRPAHRGPREPRHHASDHAGRARV